MEAFHKRGCLQKLVPLPIEADLRLAEFGQALLHPLRFLMGPRRDGPAQDHVAQLASRFARKARTNERRLWKPMSVSQIA
jgi:hypothetical protein